ncbi:MAG: metallophosphoesterase [Eubacteriales bacterium]
MVYITGDTHGDYSRFRQPKLKKLNKGDTIIVCGDFGFIWEDTKAEQKIIKKLGKKKYNVCFIDGTHENFDLLYKYRISEWNGGKVHRINGNLYHLMRGQMFKIDGLKIFTMGGGESPDIDLRFENSNWSRLEIPNKDELLQGAQCLEDAGCKADIIVTHEPPLKIKGFLKLRDKGAVRVTGLNTYFEELSNSCEFKRWFFGSMHLDKFISSSHIAVFQNIVSAHTGEQLK